MCVPEREKDKLEVKESESFLSFFPFFFLVWEENIIYIYKYIFFYKIKNWSGRQRRRRRFFSPLKYIALLEVLELKREAALLIHADLMIMTAAVDMKPTLTIIKAEKMDGE